MCCNIDLAVLYLHVDVLIVQMRLMLFGSASASFYTTSRRLLSRESFARGLGFVYVYALHDQSLGVGCLFRGTFLPPVGGTEHFTGDGLPGGAGEKVTRL